MAYSYTRMYNIIVTQHTTTLPNVYWTCGSPYCGWGDLTVVAAGIMGHHGAGRGIWTRVKLLCLCTNCPYTATTLHRQFNSLLVWLNQTCIGPLPYAERGVDKYVKGPVRFCFQCGGFPGLVGLHASMTIKYDPWNQNLT